MFLRLGTRGYVGSEKTGFKKANFMFLRLKYSTEKKLKKSIPAIELNFGSNPIWNISIIKLN